METVRYEMTVYADADGTMPQHRVKALMSDLAVVGGDAAVLEYVHPSQDSDTGANRPWGLRAVVRGDE